MKKTICILLAVFLLFSLSGCISKEAAAVDKLILAIGDVSENSGAEIESAENAYFALTEEQKAEIKNYQQLLDARKKYDELSVKGINDLIQKTIKTEAPSQADIITLTEQYEQLSDSQKELVTGYEEAIKLRDCEIAVIYAVKQLKEYVKNPTSFELIEAYVKMDVKSMGGDAVKLKYSVVNGFGGLTTDNACLNIQNGKDSLFPLAWALGKSDEVIANSLSFYVKAPEKEIELDCERIMNNLDAVKDPE